MEFGKTSLEIPTAARLGSTLDYVVCAFACNDSTNAAICTTATKVR